MMDRIRRVRSEEGFTLIELLIVVIILAVLAAIVVFAVGTFPTTARKNACRTDFRSVETAQEARKADKGSFASSTTVLKNEDYLREAPPTAVGAQGYGIATDADGDVWAITAGGTGTKNDIAHCNTIT